MNTWVKSTGVENLFILSVIKHPKVMAANTVSDAGIHNEKPVKKKTHFKLHTPMGVEGMEGKRFVPDGLAVENDICSGE